MGFTLSQLTDSTITLAHPGANSRATYRIDGRAYCFRPMSNNDQFCSHEAGFGTAHLGEGACRYHHALQAESPMIQRYSKYLKRDLHKTYTEFASDEQHSMDLRPELDMLRTLLRESLSLYQDSKSVRALEMSTKLLGSVGIMVDQIDRIQSRQVLTAATAKMLMAKALQVAFQFIDSEKVPAFIEMWRSDVTSLMQPNKSEPVEILALANIIEQED